MYMGDRPFDVAFVEQLKTAGRRWCARGVGSQYVVSEAGLNFVLLHHGRLTREMIKGKADATGMQEHGAIVQSITSVDVTRGTVDQVTTWLLLGRVRKALRRLRRIR
jgi:hypothetical protein